MRTFVPAIVAVLLLLTCGRAQELPEVKSALDPAGFVKGEIAVYRPAAPNEPITSVHCNEELIVVARATFDGRKRPQELLGSINCIAPGPNEEIHFQTASWKGRPSGKNEYSAGVPFRIPYAPRNSTLLLRMKGTSVLASMALTVIPEKRRYLRFQAGESISYGLLEGDRVRKLDGDLFGKHTPTQTTYALEQVKILTPTTPTQVLALAGNYKSHLADAVIPPKFQIVQPFFKSPSCLIPTGEAIVIPKDSPGPVHYEAELVIVIGKKCRKVSKEQALDYVFGVTCGNDVSERFWQNDEEHKDVQWWRAKGADTFGPVGPFIATGLNYDDLEIKLRLNGDEKQKERTSQLIHNIPTTVSFISQHITLHPGDLIFTGTPGKTEAIKPGDIVEVELEGVGVLKNTVEAEK